MTWNTYNRNFYEKYYDSSKTLNEKFRNDNIGIISERNTGKSLLTALLVFHYGYNSSEKLKICFLTNESFSHRLDDICYYIYGDKKWEQSHYNFYEPKYYKYKKPFMNYLREIKLDIIVIDEIFYLKFTYDELREIFHRCKENGTKVIINGTPETIVKSWGDRRIEKLKEIGNLKIINNDFIINLPNYNRLCKIKKLINND